MFTNPICHWASLIDTIPLMNFNAGEQGPDIQPFPASSAAMVALGLPAPVTIYRMEDAFGAGVVTDSVGSADLTPAGNFTTGKKAVGLWDGVSFSNKRAVEMDYSNPASKANAADATVHDYGAGDSFAWLFVYKAFHNLANLSLFGKQSSSSASGYSVWFTPNSLFFRYDGGAQVDSSVTTDAVHGFTWHVGVAVVNRNADFMQLYTDMGDGARQNIAAIGSPTNATIFSIGDTFLNSNACQIAYMALWEGANAEDIDTNWNGTYKDLFWRHGTALDIEDPLTYQDHLTNIGSVIGEDGDGILFSDWATQVAAPGGQFVWAWDDNFSHPSKLGLQCGQSHVNLLDDSDNFLSAGWAASNMNRLFGWAADLNDCPNGMKIAQRLQASANNGYVRNNTACAASTVYTDDFFVRRHSSEVANVNGALIAYDNTAGAQIAIQTFTATEAWQRVSLTYTTPVGCISKGVRIRIDTSGESIAAIRVTSRLGLLSNPIHQQNAAYGGTSAITDWRISAAAGTHCHGEEGEIEIHYICFGDNATFVRTLLGTDSAVPGQNRRSLPITAAENPNGLLYNSAAVLITTDTSAVLNQANEHTLRYRWNRNALLPCGANTELIIDAVSYPGHVGAWAGSDTVTDIHVGQDDASANQLDGLIDYVKIYSEPQLP